MFNINPVTELIKNQISNLNNNLSQIATRLSPHHFWVGKLCRTYPKSDGDDIIVRIIGLDSAGMSYRVVDPLDNELYEKDECHFIGFAKPGVRLETLSSDEEENYS
tara:strand:+ start:7611 stop:7928 length:318 start_codon:yes stop_codon:yes gene_type:complete